MNRATGSSGSMKNISQRSFLSISIPLPPLPEQRKIAEILGTWDEAIATVERLIAALEQRKQGLMQRLLTGEVRFGEFAESEWREVALSQMMFSKRNHGDEQLISEVQVVLVSYAGIRTARHS